jgi:hypothetical protein
MERPPILTLDTQFRVYFLKFERYFPKKSGLLKISAIRIQDFLKTIRNYLRISLAILRNMSILLSAFRRWTVSDFTSEAALLTALNELEELEERGCGLNPFFSVAEISSSTSNPAPQAFVDGKLFLTFLALRM